MKQPEGLKVRTNTATFSLGGHWTAKVNALPPSVNHQYKKSRSGGFYLDPKVRVFREQMAWEAGKDIKKIPSNKILSVTLWFESPRWLTKKLTVRKMDVDNVIKGTLDAMVALGLRDENIWELNVKKFFSHRERIQISIMDCGDIVEYNVDK